MRTVAVLWVMLSALAARGDSFASGSIIGVTSPGAEVIVDTLPFTVHRYLHADADGRFRVGQLEPGWYIVMIGARGQYVRVTGHDEATVATAFESEYLDSIPLAGDAVEAAFGVAPTAINDGFGLAIAGSTALEHRYTLDGVDITGTRTGALEVAVPRAFVDSVEVIEAGAGPLHGRATGAFIDTTTPHGGNDLHGSLFSTWSPGQLAGTPTVAAHGARTIDVTSKQAYATQFGGTLGGPVVKDHVWFLVGFAPQLARTDHTRTVRNLVDHDADGEPDVDPKTGVQRTDVAATEVRQAPSRGAAAIARFDVVIEPHLRGSLTGYSDRTATTTPGLVGATSTGTRIETGSDVVSTRWRARRGSIELDVDAGGFRTSHDVGASDPAVAHQPLRVLSPSTLGDVEPVARCVDGGAGDPYPLIQNCPLVEYPTGGPGVISRDIEQRLEGSVVVRDRIGRHVVELGLDGEHATWQTATRYSGGRADFGFGGIAYERLRLLRATTHEVLDDSLDDLDSVRSLAWAAYARDVWRPTSRFVLDVALRYDEQRLGYLDSAGRDDDLLRLRGVSPRIGIAYDPSGEGRAKLFARWGRIFDAAPLGLVQGGEVTEATVFVCTSPGTDCAGLPPDVSSSALAVAPEIRAPHIDELAAGVQLATVAGLAVGATFFDRRLHDVIEDVGIGGTQLGNPEALGEIDPPTRVFDALELSVARSFFSSLMLRASYTYSRLFGDYSGRISYDNGQAQPYRVSEYDILEDMPNRLGVLPQDRSHVVKIDAAYAYALDSWTSFVFGARFRALSGVPETALGSSFHYGDNEVELLPRGAFGRTDFEHSLDIHLAYHQRLPRSRSLELYVDVFNVFDDQAPFAVDNAYTQQPTDVLPISGGRYDDLIWLRDDEVHRPVKRSPSFHQPTSFYAPISTRLGARFNF